MIFHTVAHGKISAPVVVGPSWGSGAPSFGDGGDFWDSELRV